MKITVLQENLNQALNYLQKAIPSKPQLPVLASVHIKTEGSTCQLSATDLYFGVRCKVQGDISEEGELVVPGKEFKEIIASLPPGPIKLSYSDNSLSISSKHAKAKIQCMGSEDYPEFPQSDGEEYRLDAESLNLITEQVLFSASTDQARPVLTAVLFSFQQDLVNVVSTDGFRLAILLMNDFMADEPGKNSKAGRDESEDENYNFLIPSKALAEVARIQKQVQDETVKFSVSKELKQAVFSIAEVEVFVRLIEGDYPPYQKIIPSGFKTTVLFDRSELVENIKRAMIFAREASNIIRFSFDPKDGDQATILAVAPTIGEFKGTLSQAKVEGDSALIAFNARYVLDFLQSISADQIWFGMSESLKPALFRPDGQNEYQYVVMPFKITE